jgi:hypothetical protein
MTIIVSGRSLTREFNGLTYARKLGEYDFGADAKAEANRIRKEGYLVRVVKNKGHVGGPKYHRYTLYVRRA